MRRQSESGDGAFERTRAPLDANNLSAYKSGVALCLPPQSKTRLSTPTEISVKQRAVDILSAETAANIGFSSADYKSAALLQRSQIEFVLISEIRVSKVRSTEIEIN